MPKWSHWRSLSSLREDLFFYFLLSIFGNAWRRRKVSIQLLSCYIRTCHEIRDFLAILGGHQRVLWNQFVLCLWDIGKAQANICRAVHQYGVLYGQGKPGGGTIEQKKKIATHVHRDAQSISLETNSYSLSTSKNDAILSLQKGDLRFSLFFYPWLT